MKFLELVVCVDDRGKALFQGSEFRTRYCEVRLGLVRPRVDAIADATKAGGRLRCVDRLWQDRGGGLRTYDTYA